MRPNVFLALLISSALAQPGLAPIGGGSSNLDIAGKFGSPNNPNAPFYTKNVDHEISLIPAQAYLSAHQQRTFEHLVESIIKSQENIARLSPHIAKEFERSIELWRYFRHLIPEYRAIKQSHYVHAIEALRDALLRLGKDEERYINDVRLLTHELFFDNLFLVGFINHQYGSEVIPQYLTDRPGDVLGALIHFLGIDAREHLHPHCKGDYNCCPEPCEEEWEECPKDEPDCCEGPGPQPECKKHKVGKKIIKYRKKKICSKKKGFRKHKCYKHRRPGCGCHFP